VITARKSDWQLPEGVPRGTWEYAQSQQIARTYDESLKSEGERPFDLSVLERHLTQPGTLVDLGCGTGRLLLPFARRGFRCLAVDLSPQMLAIVGHKAEEEGLIVDRLLANLVELDCLRDGLADYALCMFSTLGMIRGRAHRQRVLKHAARILKPRGLLVLHVHNRWSNLWMPQARGWVLRNWIDSWLQAEVEAGDKFFDYQDVPRMFLHLYTRSELTADLHEAGLEVRELIPLETSRRHPLPRAWWFGRLRANGWIAVCGKG
jgi:ubiquinone/menaquinone biosynthesis C-methylase UbiE